LSSDVYKNGSRPMDLKTIQIHFDKDSKVEQFLSATKPLARAAQSHLVGIFTMPPVPHGSEMVGPFWEDLVKQYQLEFKPINEDMRALFEKSCRNETFTSEWRYVPGPLLTYKEGLLPESRAADLIIASLGSNPETALNTQLIPQVLLSSGRPLLLFPNTGEVNLIDATVTIAWNNTRESARAVFDALPILHRAKSIRLLTVAENKFGAPHYEPLGASDIASALSRHGLSVDIMHRENNGDGVGPTILAETKNSGANILIMGAYGHSRLRELILGGATRQILSHTKIPVLLAH